MHCLGGNATDPVWRVLASSQGISSCISLKPQHSTLTPTLTLWPNNYGVLTSLLLPHFSSSLTDSLPSLNLLCHSKTDARFMQDAPKAVWSIPYVSVVFFQVQNSILLHFFLLKCPHVQIAFLKFTSCDYQVYSNSPAVTISCIPIASVAVDLKLKSQKLVGHLIICIAKTYWIFKSLR